jgi:hypothetical protein
LRLTWCLLLTRALLLTGRCAAGAELTVRAAASAEAGTAALIGRRRDPVG